MANSEDINNQKDLNKELSATEKAWLESGKKAAQLTEESRSLTAELKDQLGIRSKTSEDEKTLLSLSRSITKSAQANKVALRESGDITKQLKTDAKTLESTKREQLILERTIGDQVDKNGKTATENASKISQLNQDRLAALSNIDRLKDQLVDADKSQQSGIESQIKGYEAQLASKEESLGTILDISSAEAQHLALSQQLVTAAQGNVDEGVKQEEAQGRINKSLGIAGGLAKAFKGAFGGLANAIGIDKVANDMKKFATEAEDAKKSVSRLQVLGVGMVSAFKGLGTTLTDPSVILTSLIKGFNDVDKAATDFQQQTGQDLNTMETSWNNFNLGLITTAEYMKAASDITKEFGVNAAAVFTPENLIEAASMTKEMGLSAKEAANLARLSKVNGGNIEMQNEAIVEGINSANRQNKTAVAHGQVLRDVANASEGIAISYAGYPGKLAEAATAARGLGMSLGDIDKIAGSLLNFESSIASEMEAELLTGRSLNLEKARELALNNDLAGVAKELANQGITSTNYSQMNRIQQEAQAKALGMNRDEMARMLLAQEMQGSLSEGALNDAQKATLEDMKRVTAQEKIATAIAKLQQAFAPIIGFIADIVSQSWVIYSIMGVALLAKMPMLVSSIKGLAGGFGAAWKNAKGLASGIGKMVSRGGTGRLKAALKPPTKIPDTKIPDTKMKPKSGVGIKDNLKGLSAGLKSMAGGKVTQGIGNLALSVIPLAGMMLSIPFLLFMGKVKLTETIQKNFRGLASGLKAMAGGKVLAGIGSMALLSLALIPSLASIPFLLFMGLIPLSMLFTNFQSLGKGVASLGNLFSQIAKGSLALFLMGAALIPAAFAFSLLAGVDVSSMLGFAIALPLLGLSVMALGLIFTNPVTMFLFGAGILGLLSLGLAILPLAAAFSILKDVDIPTIGAGLMSLANPKLIEGLLSFGGAISSLALPLLIGSVAFAILGPALLLTAVGFEMLASSDMMGTVDSLQMLSTLSPGLLATSGALFALAGGLYAISVAGLLAIPAMAAMSLFGVIGGEESGGESGGESSKKDGGMEKINANLEKLISLVEAGGDVYIDGSKVGKTLQLATSRMG